MLRLYLLLLPLLAVQALQTQQALAEFQTWFESHGGKSNSVGLDIFPSMGVGLKSEGGLFDGFKVLDIPLRIVICDATIRSSITEDQGHVFATIEDSGDRVAAFLLLQLALREQSVWAPYIRVLPAFVPNAVSWKLGNSSSLPRDSVFSELVGVQKSFERSYKTIKYDLEELLRFSGSTEFASFEMWRWAKSIVDSRGFRIRGTLYLVPYADFFNFSPHAEAREPSEGDHFLQYHKVTGDSFSVFADRKSDRGEQLLEDYGDNSNDVYMTYHGFVPDKNQFACWQFPLVPSSVLRRKGSRVKRMEVMQAVLGNMYNAQQALCLRAGQAIHPMVYRAMHVAFASSPQLDKCTSFARDPHNRTNVLECFGEHPGIVSVRAALKRAHGALNRTKTYLQEYLLSGNEVATLQQLETQAAQLSPGDDLSPLDSHLWQKSLIYKYFQVKQDLIAGHIKVLTEEYQSFSKSASVASQGETTIDTASRAARLDEQSGPTVKAQTVARAGTTDKVDAPAAEVSTPANARTDLFAPRREPLPSIGVQDENLSASQNLASTVSAFNSWIDSFNPPVVKIKAAVVGDGMRLGVVATSDINAEEVYLSLPPQAIMSASTAQMSGLKPAFDDLSKRFPRGDAYHELLFHLMYEAFVLGQNSTWAPYLATLPTSEEMGFPLFYSDHQLEQLQGMTIVSGIQQNREQIRNKFMGVKKAVFDHYPDIFTPEAFNWPHYLWAAAILDSRSIWWSNQRHLVPLLDLINCQQGPDPSRVHGTRMNPEGTHAITKAGWEFKAGEQLWENYGQPNHIYFAYHGFTMQPNAHDCAEIVVRPSILDPQAEERIQAVRWPQQIDTCLAIPSPLIEDQYKRNSFAVAESTNKYLVHALDTNEAGAAAALVRLAEKELRRFHTTHEQDEDMLQQVLQTAAGDTTFIDVDEAIVRYRSGQKKLLMKWVEFAKEKLTEAGYTF